MGTRSKTNVLDSNGNIIISIYRQFDGDIEHHAQDLKKFVKKNRLARRIDKECKCPTYNGGMEDLAGELFCYLKTQTKHVMPAHPDTNNDWAYEYEVGFYEGGEPLKGGGGSTSHIYIKCRYWDQELFHTVDWKVI